MDENGSNPWYISCAETYDVHLVHLLRTRSVFIATSKLNFFVHLWKHPFLEKLNFPNPKNHGPHTSPFPFDVDLDSKSIFLVPIIATFGLITPNPTNAIIFTSTQRFKTLLDLRSERIIFSLKIKNIHGSSWVNKAQDFITRLQCQGTTTMPMKDHGCDPFLSMVYRCFYYLLIYYRVYLLYL